MDADLPARWQADSVWCGDSGVRVGHLEGERDPAVVDRFVMLRRGSDLEATYIPDWPLHWIRSIHNLMRYTGDRELVAGLLPQAEGVLRWFLPYRGVDGLLTDVPVAGTSAALNALWARGLRDFEDMARWLGDDGRGAWAHGLRGGVRRGFE